MVHFETLLTALNNKHKRALLLAVLPPIWIAGWILLSAEAINDWVQNRHSTQVHLVAWYLVIAWWWPFFAYSGMIEGEGSNP